MIDSIRTKSPSALPVKIHPAKWAHDQWLTFKLTAGSSEDPAPKLRSAVPVEQGEMETVTEVVINCQLAQPPTLFLFTHIKRVAAIIAALSFLFVGLWFRRFNAPRTTTVKLPVLRYAKAGAAVERAHAP